LHSCKIALVLFQKYPYTKVRMKQTATKVLLLWNSDENYNDKIHFVRLALKRCGITMYQLYPRDNNNNNKQVSLSVGTPLHGSVPANKQNLPHLGKSI